MNFVFTLYFSLLSFSLKLKKMKETYLITVNFAGKVDCLPLLIGKAGKLFFVCICSELIKVVATVLGVCPVSIHFIFPIPDGRRQNRAEGIYKSTILFISKKCLYVPV